MRKPETHLQQRIRKALLRDVGGYWVKIHVSEFQEAGLPDLLGCVHGFGFFLEVKPPGEEPSKIQELTMKQIREKGGGFSCVVQSPQEAVKVVRECLIVKLSS